MNKYAVVLLVFSLLTSCQVFRQNRNISPEKTIQKVQNENYIPTDFNWFRGKMKVNLQSDFYTGNMMLFLKIRNDSLIWGSVTAVVGFEVFRFFITKDSFTLIDRMHKTYYTYPISFITDKFGIPDVNYKLAQNFFIGNALFELNSRFEQRTDENNIIMNLPDHGFSKTVYIDKKTFRITRYILKNESSSQHLEIEYKGKIKNNGNSIPEEILLQLISPNKMTADMTYTNIVFNKPMDFNTEIPASYEKAK